MLITALTITLLAQPLTDSLPRTEGEVVVAGLAAPVEIARDALGIPVIRGDSLEDVARAQGFVHAQERFFQMDAARRLAAGRLAEIVGREGLALDRRSRRSRFAAVAAAVTARLADSERRLVEAYAEGVNAGLADLGSPPPEYLFLRVQPEPWHPEDSVLVMFSLFDVLNFNATIERGLGAMKAALPPALYEFLTPADTRFEAPLLPAPGDRDGFRPAPIPGPDVVDLRGRAPPDAPGLVLPAPPGKGSNAWAVAGVRSAHGGAILANDPHLPFSVPGVWFRVELEWGPRRAAGVSLPGVPGIIIGTNRTVAWGFTNTMGDFQDLVVIEPHPDDPGRYRTPDGFEAFDEIEETIHVRGERPVPITLRATRWGVIVDHDWEGRPLALKWTALDPDMVNLRILGMMSADTLDDAVALARGWYGPSQNVLVADGAGRIAWVVSGYLPRREGLDGATPVSWARRGVGWSGALAERWRPSVVDPPEGVLYTANNRTVDVAWARRIGNGWELGVRAQRIAHRLAAKPKLDERDLLAIQLDTRVAVLEPYRTLWVEAAREHPAGGGDPRVGAARRIVQEWNGAADADQAGARILDAYRRALHGAIIGPLVAPARDLDPRFRYLWFRDEEVVQRVLETRPDHLLPPGARDWDDLLRSTLASTIDELTADPAAAGDGRGGLSLPWGEANRARIAHPLARGAPALARMIGLPADPQSGHRFAVRVATPTFGASMRMVVAPGREPQGILHMPGGESGHPMSPHFRDGHRAWRDGLPSPFAAGEPASRLTLRPAATDPDPGGQ